MHYFACTSIYPENSILKFNNLYNFHRNCSSRCPNFSHLLERILKIGKKSEKIRLEKGI